MAAPFPETVQKVLGETAGRDLAHWVEDLVADLTVPRAEWNAASGRLIRVEQDLGGLRQDVVGLKQEVAGLKQDLAGVKETIVDTRAEVRDLRREMTERFDRMGADFNARFDRLGIELNKHLAAQTRWTIAVMALFGSLITLLLGIAQLRP